jgi:hypothetical protein
MKYTANGDTVTLEMTQGEYARLLVAIGIATGVTARDGDEKTVWSWVDFANRLNTGNPNFIPYEIPDESKPDADRS